LIEFAGERKSLFRNRAEDLIKAFLFQLAKVLRRKGLESQLQDCQLTSIISRKWRVFSKAAVLSVRGNGSRKESLNCYVDTIKRGYGSAGSSFLLCVVYFHPGTPSKSS